MKNLQSRSKKNFETARTREFVESVISSESPRASALRIGRRVFRAVPSRRFVRARAVAPVPPPSPADFPKVFPPDKLVRPVKVDPWFRRVRQMRRPAIRRRSLYQVRSDRA